ncbi:MAG: galactose oxidase [Verrucomicrobia bacterium]|nr:galactose oxidase [Verrucomicrobiota bacterium]
MKLWSSWVTRHVPWVIRGIAALVLLTGFQIRELSAADISKHWKRLPDLPDQIGVAGAFAGVSGGVLIVAGGANFPDAPPWEGGTKVWHDTIWALEKPGGEWRKAGRLSRPNGYGVSATSRLGLICLGGGDAAQHFSHVWSLNYRAGTATALPLRPIPSPLANACGLLIGERIYMAGGIESPTSTVASAEFLRLDLQSSPMEWNRLPTWPGPARQLAIAGAHHEEFYLFGGTSLEAGPDGKPRRTYLRDAYVFQSGRWKRLADLPFPLAASPSPAATVNGKLIIFGGDDAPSTDPKTHPGFRDEMLEYDPKTDRWTVIGRLPAPRVTTPVVFWNGGYVIISGEIRRGVRSREVWMWTP